MELVSAEWLGEGPKNRIIDTERTEKLLGRAPERENITTRPITTPSRGKRLG